MTKLRHRAVKMTVLKYVRERYLRLATGLVGFLGCAFSLAHGQLYGQCTFLDLK